MIFPQRILLLLPLAILCATRCASAQPLPEEGRRSDEAVAKSGECAPISMSAIHFTLGRGDELRISVQNIPELAQTVKVPPSGQVSIPLAGTMVVTGKPISYVANWLERGFKEYYANPHVTISVKASRRNKVSILGEVSNPGIYAIGDKIRLKDALAMAGNLTATAEPRSIVMVRGDLDHPQVSLLDAKDLTSENGLEKNVMLDSGDILYVPGRLISNIDTISTCLHTIIRPVPEIESGTFIELASEDTLEAGEKQSVFVVR